MRLIDADALAGEMKKRQDNAGKWLREAKDHETATRADAVLSFIYEVKLTLDKMPTVDAVPVVRCRECKWFAEGKWCRNPNNDMVQGGTTSEWFCGDGKRKGGADDGKRD